jgi:Sporulation and spore germination
MTFAFTRSLRSLRSGEPDGARLRRALNRRFAGVHIGSRWFALAAVSVAFLGGCGLPSDKQPRPIAADKVPFNLLSSTTTTAPTNEGGVQPVALLYFMDSSQHLSSVEKPVASLDPFTVLELLVSTRPGKDLQGLTSAIPDGTRVLRADLQPDRTLVVTLSAEIQNVQAPDQKSAFGQLVWTATDPRMAVSAVRFRVSQNGNETDLSPPNDQSNTNQALTRGDYNSLQSTPKPAPTVTPTTRRQ